MTDISALQPDADIFLRQLNSYLAQEHDRSIVAGLPEQYATLHVVGVPRSGTTLTMQLMASHLPVSYPSNMSAMFWSAPVYGVALARKLFGDSPDFSSALTSSYGRTTDPLEPHEFGRFWLNLLGYESLDQKPGYKMDRQRVRDTLVNMTHAAGRAFAFKSFLPVWHLDELATDLNKSLFVHVTRDPLENALSLLNARRKYAKSESDWVGIKPFACRQYENAPAAVQVASQVVEVERTIREKLEAVEAKRVVRIRLEEISENPTKGLEQVSAALAAIDGHDVTAIPPISPLPSRSPSSYMPSTDINAIKKAFEDLAFDFEILK